MAPAEVPIRCPNCGTEVALVDTICWRCYRRLPPPPRPQPAPARRRRSSGFPATTLAVTVLIAGLGLYLWHVRSSPTAALTAFLRAQASGDVKAMYELMSLRSRDLMAPEALVEQAQRRGRENAYVVRSVKREEGGAEITVEVILAGAAAGAAPVLWHAHMVREQGGWRMDMVRTDPEALGPNAPITQRDLIRQRR